MNLALTHHAEIRFMLVLRPRGRGDDAGNVNNGAAPLVRKITGGQKLLTELPGCLGAIH